MAKVKPWHDSVVRMPVLWVYGVCGLMLGSVSWLPAPVRGSGWLVALVCLPWLFAKDIRATWKRWRCR